MLKLNTSLLFLPLRTISLPRFFSSKRRKALMVTSFPLRFWVRVAFLTLGRETKNESDNTFPGTFINDLATECNPSFGCCASPSPTRFPVAIMPIKAKKKIRLRV